jgi:hypothetical protein
MKLKTVCGLLAALSISTGVAAEQYRWDAVAMGGGGLVNAVVTSKKERGVVYARTDVGGAYRWDAAQGRWISLMDWVSESERGFMGVEALAIDPRNAGNVYMLVGTSYFNNGKTAIVRSSDYGKTFSVVDVSAQFKAHGNGMGRTTGEKLQVDPGDSNLLYVGTRRDGLFKSTDAGQTWNRVAGLDVTSTPNDNGISFVLLDPASVDGGRAQVLFVGVSRLDSAGPNLYFSYDGGETFEPIEGGPAGLFPQRAVMAQDGKMYITYANGAGPHPTDSEPLDRGQVWEYDSMLGNWTNITPKNMNSPFNGISIDPNNPKRLVLSTINTWMAQPNGAWGDRIFTSNDAGRTWQDVFARGFTWDGRGPTWVYPNAIHWTGSVEFDPFDSKTVWVTSGNGLFKTTNIDAPVSTWGFDVAGIEETVPLRLVSTAGQPLVSAIGDYDGFVHTDPSQYGTMHTPRIGTTTGLAASADGSVLARVGKDHLYYSTTAGASWVKAASKNGNSGELALSADGAVLLHRPANSTTTYRSLNYGGSWDAVAGLAKSDTIPVGDKVNPSKFYAYDSASGNLLASSDGGVSFSAKGKAGAGGSPLIVAAPGNEGHVWVCLPDGVAYTTDSGDTFTRIANVTGCGAFGLGKAAPGAAYHALYMWGTVGGVKGLLRSIDKGVTWERVNDDAHEYGGPGNGNFVVGDMNTYGTVYMSTVGRGIVYGKADASGDVTVSAVDSRVPDLPPPATNKCEYVVTSTWWGGGIADIRITNNRPGAVRGWSISWTYPDNTAVNQLWNANVSGQSPTYTATDVGWNATIEPGATVSFGMVFSGPQNPSMPTLSGDVCK